MSDYPILDVRFWYHRRRRIRVVKRRLNVWLDHRFSPGLLGLLLLAIAPLWDGVFASAVSSGQITTASARGLTQAIVFGLVAFSGGGVVSMAMTLTGTVRQQVRALAGVYAVVGIGVGITLALLHWTAFSVPVQARIVFAMVLLSLAVLMAGISVKFTLELSPLKVFIGLGAVALIFHYLTYRITVADTELAFALKPAMAGSAIALMTAFLTTTMTVFFRKAVQNHIDPVWLNRGGAAAIVVIAMSLLEFPTPPGTSLVAFVLLTAYGGVRRYRIAR